LTSKGNLFLGVELGMNGSSYIRPNGSDRANFYLRPSINLQYNILNRLSVVGGVYSNRNIANSSGNNSNSGFDSDIGLFASLRYYPFKSNGFFVEGGFRNEFNFDFNDDDDNDFDNLDVDFYHVFNPGYSFMIGKNKNVGFDVKLPFFIIDGRLDSFSLIHLPTVGIKIPFGKKSK